jgi:hypothetical protein
MVIIKGKKGDCPGAAFIWKSGVSSRGGVMS